LIKEYLGFGKGCIHIGLAWCSSLHGLLVISVMRQPNQRLPLFTWVICFTLIAQYGLVPDTYSSKIAQSNYNE